MEERIPPHDMEAERSVLGAMFHKKDVIPQVIQLLRPEYFYRPAHMQIFRAMISLYNRNEPVDWVTVNAEMEKMGARESAGGTSYLMELTESVPGWTNVDRYAQIVSNHATMRKLIDVGSTIMSEGFDKTQDVDDVMEHAQKQIMEVSRERVRDDFVALKDVLMPVLDSIHQSYDNEDQIMGIPTGYSDFDKITGGFQKGDLIILAARPGMGKTTLAMNFAMHVAEKKHAVAIFSLEMPKEQLAMRLLCSEARINMAKLKSAQLADGEYKDLAHAMGKLSEMPIYIDTAPDTSPLELKAKIRRLQMEADIKLIVVDYLQLMRSSRRKSENRMQEVSEIVREVKAFAKESGIPLIALSQLGRDIEKRQGDQTPRLSDLRESGELEQTADLVLFINRDYYDNESKEAKLIIAKHRNGSLGDIDLFFRKEYSRFEPLAKHEVVSV